MTLSTPKGWKLQAFKEISDINPSKPKYLVRDDKEQVSFIGMEAVDETTGTVVAPQVKTYGEVKSGYTYFENGDIIFAKITPCMQNGKSAIVDKLIGGFGFGSSEFIVIRAKPGISNQWLLQFLRTAEFRKQAKDHFTGSAGQQRVPKDFVENYRIPYPNDADEVNRSLAKLNFKIMTSYELRAAAQKQQEAVNALQTSILREIFRYKAQEKLPDGWEWQSIKELSSRNSQTFRRDTYALPSIKYIDISSVDNVRKQITGYKELAVTDAPSRAKHILDENDIVISTVRPNLNAVALVSKELTGCIGSSGFTVIKSKQKISPNFLFLFFISPMFIERVNTLVQGAMYPAISDDDVKNTLCPIPTSYDEQVNISQEMLEKLENASKMREMAKTLVETANTISTSFLRQAFGFT